MSDRDMPDRDMRDRGMSDPDTDSRLRELYPEEFRQLAIGVPINADMNKVLFDERAFVEDELVKHGLFDTELLKRTEGRLHLWAGASDQKIQDTVGWNFGASAELNLGIADFSARFYIKEAKDACERSTKAGLVGMSIEKNQLMLIKSTDEKYYSCTSASFQECYTTLVEAAKKAIDAAAAHPKQNATPAQEQELDTAQEELDDALREFYRRFGTGFVSGLDLVAYGIVEASWMRETGSHINELTTGGGVAASLPFVGAQAASDYVTTHTDQKVIANLVWGVAGEPAQSAQFKWAKEKAETLKGGSLEEILNGEAWTQKAATEVPTPATPVLHAEAKGPEAFTMPQLPGPLGVVSDAIRRLQSRLLDKVQARAAASSEEPASPSADGEEIEEKQTTLKIANALPDVVINKVALAGPGALIQAALKIQEDSEAAESGGEVEAVESPDESTQKDGGQETNGANTTTGAATTGANTTAGNTTVGGGGGGTLLNLGGYVPSGYRYWAWGEVFHDLKLALECAPAQVVFRQSLVWYSIRDMFAQYLEFCANFHGVVRNRRGDPIDIKNRATAFRNALDEVSKDLTTDLTTDNLSDELLKRPADSKKADLDLLQKLEDRLKEELVGVHNRFGDMYEHYKFWIDNYEWLKLAPFGVVALIERGKDKYGEPQYYYQENPSPANAMRESKQPDGCALAPADFAPADLITRRAYRVYPIISTDAHGKPHFVWVGAPSPLQGDNIDASTRYSGFLTLQPNEAQTPAALSKRWERWSDGIVHPREHDGADVLLNETALPMLIHQSKEALEEIVRADRELPSGVLADRWNNRKRVFGMHLFPGVGDEDCFGHEFPVGFLPTPPFGGRQVVRDIREGAAARLLEKAGQLAYDATDSTASAHVLPVLPKDDEQRCIWGLLQPAGVVGAYYANQNATFFWGPEDGLWDKDLFTPCPVKFVPIDYSDVKDALGAVDGDIKSEPEPWAKVGGGAMWREPRPDLMTQHVSRPNKEWGSHAGGGI